MIEIKETPLTLLTDKLKAGQNFKFLKFGDGEFLCYRGGEFRSKEFFVTPEITSDYKQIINNLKKEHLNALQPMVLRTPELAPLVPVHDWYDADILHNSSIKGRLFPFFEALQDRHVVLVCNQYMTQTKKYFPNCHNQIVISDFNCYQDKEYVMNSVMEFQPDTVFLLSASVLSEYIIYHSREDCTFIDTGSVFEPYLNRAIRSYHKDMREETIQKNLGNLYELYKTT